MSGVLMRTDPEATYLEVRETFQLNRSTGDVTPGLGVTVHAKIGNRWEKMLLMPNEDENLGGLMKRLGDWIEDAPGGGFASTSRMLWAYVGSVCSSATRCLSSASVHWSSCALVRPPRHRRPRRHRGSSRGKRAS